MPLRRAAKNDDQDDLVLGDELDARVSIPDSSSTIGGSLVDRIGEQVIEATRKELTETIDALNAAAERFESLEVKLAGQTDGIEADEARRNEAFSKLEKRLEDVEASLRGEIDRSRRSADALEVIIDEVRAKLNDAGRGSGDVESLAAELATLSARIDEAASAVGDADANVAKLRVGIDERLDTVADSVASTVAESVASTVAAIEVPAAPAELNIDDALAPLSERIEKLAEHMAAIETSLVDRPDESSNADLVELIGSTKAAADSVQADIGKLRSSFDRRFDKLRNSISEAATGIELEPALAPINEQVSNLAAQLSALDQKLDAAAEAAAAATPPAVEYEAITSPLTAKLDEIQSSLQALHAALPAPAEPLDPAAITGPIAEKLDEVQTSLHAALPAPAEPLDPAAITGPIAEQLAALKAELAEQISSSQPHDQVTVLAELVTKAVATVDETDANVAKLRAGLDARIESLHEAIAASASSSASPDDLAAQIQGFVDDAITRVTGIEVTARISQVLERLDSFLDESRPSTTAKVAADLKASVDDLYRQVDQLTSRFDASWSASQQLPDADDESAISERLGQVSATLDTSLRAGRDALESLKASVERVNRVVEKAADDDPTFEALAPAPDAALESIANQLGDVEKQVRAATEHFGAIERGEVTGAGAVSAALRSIERLEAEMASSFGDLRRQIAETANVVYASAEAAVGDPDDSLAQHLEKVRAAARQLVEAAEPDVIQLP